MPQSDDTSSLEHAREHLYEPEGGTAAPHPLLSGAEERTLPHEWRAAPARALEKVGPRHVKLAWVFFAGALGFFVLAAGLAGFTFFFGGNTVSVDKVAIDIQGPATVAGGDTVPLSITITNRNAVAIENATIAIDFPASSRDATDVTKPYPHYLENLGTIASGASVTRSIKVVLFGGAGEKLSLPVAFSYGTGGSNARFMKNSTYALTISTTPLSVSIDTQAEAVSGQPLTLRLTVNSNAPVPIDNVVLTGALPFGFSVTSSSRPFTNSSFLLGRFLPGARVSVTITGTLVAQDNEQRVFHFTVGTAKSAGDQTLAVGYMTQDATVAIAAPFISTVLALNGDTSPNVVIAPGAAQNVSLTYTNTLTTSVTDATVAVGISGATIDYTSIRTPNGFYNSATRTIIFSKDTDSSLAALAPNASGIGSFSFQTLPTNPALPSPTITFTTSVSGTRIGQANVPSQISSIVKKTAKVATAIALTITSLHATGPIQNTGLIPLKPDQPTTFTISWSALNTGSAVAGGTLTTTLPSYVTYTGAIAGSGTFSYNDASRMVTWDIGDLAQGARAQGYFQVSITPSTSQRGSVPTLTRVATFSGYDRFAGVQISAVGSPAMADAPADPGYKPSNSGVQ